MSSVHQPEGPKLPLEEKLEKENEEQSNEEKLMKMQLEEKEEKQTNEESKKEKENKERAKEGRIMKITELYNTSQKILIACTGDFLFALDFATQLGDARNIVVISPFGCGEMRRLIENSGSHMLELKRLGATIVFNVDFKGFEKDSRDNNKLYDRILLDQRM